MYRAERETYYNRILALYSKYIPQDMIYGRLQGKPIYIDTDSRIFYNDRGQAIGKFVH